MAKELDLANAVQNIP
jgi:hypothetical protein